ncbi:MAG: ribonuclease HI family protein [Cystobacterineae bacterium]|nr:ribonuclease HI family protein [Cystobacterineae bacterium]
MRRKATAAQVIRCVAQKEALEQTRACFPGLSEKALRALLWQAASSLEAEPPLPLEWAEETSPRADPLPNTLAPPQEAFLPPARVVAETGAPQEKHSFLRIYSDGASRGNPGPAGAGAVLVDLQGKILERLGRFLGEQTNNHAEYQGALLGLRRAKALGASSIELWADSQLLIRQLQGSYRVKNAGLLPLYTEARGLLAQFSKIKLVHVPREKNEEADRMSNRAIDEGLEF